MGGLTNWAQDEDYANRLADHPMSGWAERGLDLEPVNTRSGITTPPGVESVSFPGIGTQRVASWEVPPPRTELIWAAIDLDGTLAKGVWTPESNGRDIGKPIERNVRKLEELLHAGYKIVIHTARGWEHYQTIESWLDFHCIPYDRIVCGKLLAAVYVDDRAVESEQPSWHPMRQRARQAAALDYHDNGYDEFPPACD